MSTPGCRCGHAAHGHYRKGTAARAGACRDLACSCRAFAPGNAPEPAPARDPTAARPMTPPRRDFPIHQRDVPDPGPQKDGARDAGADPQSR